MDERTTDVPSLQYILHVKGKLGSLKQLLKPCMT